MNNLSISPILSKILKNNTLLVNIAGFFGLLIVGWLLYGNQLLEESDEIILISVFFALVVLSFPVFTAWALLEEDKKGLQQIMRFLNWGLIIFWIIGIIFIIVMNLPKSLVFVGAIFLAFPGWMNIRALSLVINSDKKINLKRSTSKKQRRSP